jgi:phage shock protein C
MTAFDHIRATIRRRSLYRDASQGLIFGVCAGLAWWLGVKRWAVRLAAVLLLLIWPGFALVSYLIAALVLDRRPADARWDDVFVDEEAGCRSRFRRYAGDRFRR